MRQHWLKIGICFGLLWTGSPVKAEVATGVIQQSLGRDFGIVTGDIINHRFILQLPAGYQLSESSLPATGELNYWLALQEVNVKKLDHNNQRELYQLSLQYQTFYAPLDVRTLKTPAHELRAHKDGETTLSTRLPDWQFTMSPLKDIAPRGVGGNETQESFMKPALLPLSIATAGRQQAIVILACVTLALIVIFAVLKGWLWRRKQSPFQQARRQIKPLLSYENAQMSDYKEAFQALHTAFNQSAGYVLFIHHLPAFLQQNPSFVRHEQEITNFFRQSDLVLFQQKTEEIPSLKKLLGLTKKLIRAESIKSGEQ